MKSPYSKFHRMIAMHPKYDNIHKNVIFYALFYVNTHIITCINYIYS